MSRAIADALDHLADRLDQLTAKVEEAAKRPTPVSYRPRVVADITGISYDRVLELIHEGQLGHVPVGRLLLVPHDEVMAYIERNRISPTQ